MLGLAKRVGARFLLTSTSEVYGDPLQHPQVETYWGNVNPIGEFFVDVFFIMYLALKLKLGLNKNTGVSLCKWQVSEAVTMRENVLLKH